MSYILDPSSYKPDYVERENETCPHCDGDRYARTNRWLYKCLNKECGRYW